MHINKFFKLVIPSLGLLIVLVGCSQHETPVSRFYGTSYEIAKQSQIHNPEAGVADGPSTGLSGSAGVGVMNRYNDGFQLPKPETQQTTTYNISVGGVGENE